MSMELEEGPESDLIWQSIAGYLPLHDTEIELVAGDLVTNVKDLRNGWSLGRNVTRDSVGIFPTDYIEPQPEPNLNKLKDKPPKPPVPKKPSKAEPTLIANPDAIDNASPFKERPKHVEGNIIENPHTYEAINRLNSVNNNHDLENGFPDADLEDYSCNSLPLPQSPRKNKGGKKPHMFVKPNPGKNIFRPSSDTPVKGMIGEIDGSPTRRHSMTEDSRSSPVQRRSASGTPPPGRGGRRSGIPPGQLPVNSMELAEDGEEECRDPMRSGTSATNPMHISEPLIGESEMASPSDASMPLTPSLETTHRQNATNENIIRNSPRTQHKNQKFAEAKHRYYQDYRTLECPALSDSPPQSIKFKPILKNKGNYGTNRGRANEIYYNERQDPQRSLRLIISVLVGLFIGFVLFLWLHYALEYTFMVAVLISAITAILLMLFLAMSRLCRCVTALLLPSLCTTRGRIAFLIIITGFLLDGPITNIYVNMGEVSRSMSCSAEQSYNQSMLLLQPFDTMMLQLNKTVSRLHKAAYNVSVGLAPINEGLENVEIGIYEGKLGLTGLAQTCKRLVDGAFYECTAGIESAKNQCLGMVNALGQAYMTARDSLEKLNPELWAPKHAVSLTKRQTFGIDSTLSSHPENKRDVCELLDNVIVCQSLNDSDVLCQPSGWAGIAIHDAINATQTAMRHLKSTLRFDINPEPNYEVRYNATKSVFQVRRHIQQEFYRRTANFHLTISIMKKILPAAVLLLIYVAYVHIKNYVSKDTYDNVYVTPQFKTLDQKRCEVAGESLLPLKRYERNFLIDTTVSELSVPEDGLYRIGLCVLILHVLIAFMCYFFDYILYWILALMRKHGEPGYDFSGKDSLHYVIKGEGVITDLLHIFLKGFHPANLFGYTLDTHYCLPKPIPPSIVLLLVVFILYFTLVLTILLKAYILRFRNRVTAFFYPDREKARIVHLYNVVLNHRYRMPKLLQHRAKVNCRERQLRQQISVIHQMAAKLPPCRIFAYKQSQCLVCHGMEDQTFRDCQTEHCMGVFCAECYDDLGRFCPICHQTTTDYSDEEDYEDLEDDLQPYYRSSKIYV